MVPQPFAAGGNRPYLELWVVTGGPWYPRYKTLRERERERERGCAHGRQGIRIEPVREEKSVGGTLHQERYTGEEEGR
jgi:hypothetical protein